MVQICVNKTKLRALCQELGYNPSRNAEFMKAFRDGVWWLEWGDDGTWYRASLFVDRGHVCFSVRWKTENKRVENWECIDITNDQLSRLGLTRGRKLEVQK